MNRATLKKLANLTVADKDTGGKIEEFVLKKLSRADLRVYLFYLRQEIKNRKVFVRTASAPEKAQRDKIDALFLGKDIEMNYETDASLGAGIQIEYKDSLLELSMRRLITQTFDKLRENL